MYRYHRTSALLLSGALFAALAGSLPAQPPAPTEPTIGPVLDVPPVDEVPQPGRADLPPVDQTALTVQLEGAALSLYLETYQKLTGNIVIQDSQLDTGLALTLNLPPGYVPRQEELIELIEKSMLLNGFVFVPSGERTVKLLNWNAKNPRSVGLPIYSSPQDIPPGESVISYFMEFTYINVADAQTIFSNTVLPNTYGIFVPVPNRNALIITENTANVARLIELKEMVDKPSTSGVETEFVKLYRADAERVAETITTLIEETTQQGGTTNANAVINAPNQPGQDPNAPPQPPSVNVNVTSSGGLGGGTFSEYGLVPGTVKLVPDVRTNSILVVTRPSNMQRIKDLIIQFDRPSENTLPFERQLYYRRPSDLLPVLQNMLADTADDAQGGVASPTGGAGGVSNLSGGAGSGGNRNATTTRNVGGGAGGTGAGGSGGISLSQQAPSEEQPPSSAVIGKTILIADDRNNSILIGGPAENIERAVQMIDALDVRPKQVFISSVIGQLNLSDDLDFGVSYLQRFKEVRNGGEAGGIASSLITAAPPVGADGFINAIDLQQPADFLNRSGLLMYGTIADSLDVYVNALEATTNFKTLARPTVYTANNKQAIISSGQSIPVPTSTVSNLVDNDSTAVSSSIGYQDVNLELRIIPQINPHREVTLDIQQANDNVLGTVNISGNEVPSIATQSLITTVTVPDKTIVVLGGLISESDQKSRTGLPFLGRIPVLGNLFSSSSTTKIRSELIVLIQPTVIETDEEMIYKSYQEEVNADVGGSAHLHLQGRAPEIRRAQPANRTFTLPGETQVETTRTYVLPTK